MDSKGHWEAVHTDADADDVSWYQAQPALSLRMLARAGVPRSARVLDVGTGVSGLPAHLVAAGYGHVTGLDLSGEALRKARARMGAEGDKVEWVEADVLAYAPPHPFDVWHDRAVLHFLTGGAEQARYRAAVARATAPGSVVILATFAPEGPETCSGLPVARHSPDSLAALLGPGFQLVAHEQEDHRTPWDTVQAFTWALFRRVA